MKLTMEEVIKHVQLLRRSQDIMGESADVAEAIAFWTEWIVEESQGETNV